MEENQNTTQANGQVNPTESEKHPDIISEGQTASIPAESFTAEQGPALTDPADPIGSIDPADPVAENPEQLQPNSHADAVGPASQEAPQTPEAPQAPEPQANEESGPRVEGLKPGIVETKRDDSTHVYTRG